MRRKNTPKKILMEKLDRAWSKFIRERDGKCMICGSTNRLSAHHIFSRRYMSTRWYTGNGLTLCYPCHMFFAHQKYEEFRDKVIEIQGAEEFETLKRYALEIKKWDKEELQLLLESF